MGQKPKCNLSEYKKLVKESIKADLDGTYTYTPILLEGPPGIGKTQSIKQVAKELSEELGVEFGFYEFNAGTRTASDLWGIPFPNENGETLRWIKDEKLPRDKDSYGIFYCTEITSCTDEQLKVGLLELLSYKEIVGYKLPEKWYILADGNRKKDGNVFSSLGFPIRNRLIILEVEFDLDTWKNWIMESNFHKYVKDYVNRVIFESEVITFDPNKEKIIGEVSEDNYVCATPRSWESVSNILKGLESNDISENSAHLMIKGAIGSDMGKTFINKINSGKTGDLSESLATLKSIIDNNQDNDTEWVKIFGEIYKILEVDGGDIIASELISNMGVDMYTAFQKDLVSKGKISLLNVEQTSENSIKWKE